MEALSDRLPTGHRLEDYRIDDILGRGGFAITYKAFDTALERPVAIKEYLPQALAARAANGLTVQARSGADQDYRYGLRQFLDEARRLARFQHNNIVHVLRHFEANDTAYLVMFYEPGRSLSQWLDEHPGPVPEATLCRWFVPILRGLVAVHDNGLLHRDINPGNIYLRDGGEPLLIDFGSARQAVGRHSRSITRIVSDGYAPVEQYGSDGSRQGAHTDLYALGATLYRCISGADPVDALTRQSALTNREADPLEPARQLGKGYSCALLGLIDKLMSLPIHDRPESAAVVQERLAALDQPGQSPAAGGRRPVKQGTGTRKITEAEHAEAEGGKAGKQAGRGKEGARLTGRLGIGTKPPVRLARRAGAVAALVLLAVGGLLIWPGLESSMRDPSGGEDPPVVVEKPGAPADPILQEASAPPLEAPGRLMLELAPADAQVTLPGVDSPYRPGIELPAGEYRVVVRQAGYEEFADTVRIEAGQRTSKAIALVAQPGRLVLELAPSDARVILPDIKPRYRPGIELPAGEYRVIVRREGYEEFTGTVRIEAGRRTSTRIALVEQLGNLVLELAPPDAQVILPNIESGYRSGMALPAGEYWVVVRREGYEEFTGTVRIESGERTTRSIVLRRARGAERAVGTVFRDTLKDGGEGPAMVVLPTGRFRMGSPSGERDRDSDEGPVRTVTIGKRIAMGRYEVTFAEYDRFVAATSGRRPDDEGWGRGSRPVIDVSQENAQAYATWLSAQTGKTYRLPTEAEWEYAARAGTTTTYSWGNEIGVNRANCDGCGSEWDYEQTAPVGSFAANAFGLFDMHGNVREWVEDCYVDSYTGAPSDGSARTSGCVSRGRPVVRGGSWNNIPRHLRAAFRTWYRPSYRSYSFGFRLVQDLNP